MYYVQININAHWTHAIGLSEGEGHIVSDGILMKFRVN